MIRVVLAEDQGMFRSAVRRLLELEGDIEVVGEGSTGVELLATVEAERPDVAVVDIEMPDMDGLTAAERIRDQVPECKVLIVTTFGRPGFFQRAMAGGAAGFVLKDAPAEALADAIRRCAAGDRIIDPGLAAAAMRIGASPLSAREREVLVATTSGAGVAEISKTLHLSQGTVRNKVSSAIAKLGARNRADAVRIAGHNGWL
ncbi:MAG: response regulator transcription factor [Candidatus Dormibacteraceae bacterium]